jgi:hypothetical protein
MFDRIQRQIPAIRATEYAAIARWFAPSPVGLLYYGTDGTARPIAADRAEHHRAEAERAVETYLQDLPAQGPLFLGLIFAAIIIAWCIADLFGLSKTGAIPAGFGVGAAGAHLVELTHLFAMRGKLRAIRAAISAELRATAPVPGTIAAQFRRRNPFKIALEALVLVIGIFAMLAMHDEWLLTAIPMWIYIAVVPLAWLLFALMKYRDAKSGVTRRRLV